MEVINTSQLVVMDKPYTDYYIGLVTDVEHVHQLPIDLGIMVRVFSSHRKLALLLNFYHLLVIDEEVCDFEIRYENRNKIIEEIKRVQDNLLDIAHKPYFDDLVEPYHLAVDRICARLPGLLRLIDEQ